MRKTLFILFCCTGVLLLGYTGFRGYRVWRQRHMLKLAHAFLAKSDARNAMLSVSQVLRANPLNVEATRMMADLAEAGQSPNALSWRKRVVELNPHSLNDRISLAQTALSRMDTSSASNALAGVALSDRQQAAYQNIAGVVAAASNEPLDAESHFLEAARLEPQNTVPQLYLATLRIQETNEAARAKGRASLEQLGANPTNGSIRCQALRELTGDALRFKDQANALAFSKRLLQETNATFSDKILRLNVLLAIKDMELKPTLAAYQRDAGEDPGKIYQLATWQAGSQSPKEGLDWLKTLPLKIQTNQPVALLEAQCYTALGDWRTLQTTLDKQNWGELEFVRHSFQARSLRGQDLTTAAKAEWGLAIKSAAGRKNNQVMLLRMAAQWGWQSEGEELLWTIITQYPGEKWAVLNLTRAFLTSGRTRSLMALYNQQLKTTPTDTILKNNLAMTALLLDAKEFRPYELAREVYEKAPTSPIFASTYGFALYLQGKSAQALPIFEKLTPEELGDPSVSGYYGLVLKATGNRAKANKYLELTAKAKLLPEEKKLFEAARTRA